VVVFVQKDHDSSHAGELRYLGVEVVPTPAESAAGNVAEGGDLDLIFVLEELGRRGVRGVLVEGGGETAGRFVIRGLADKLTLFYAPKLLGSGGVPLMGSLKVAGMDATPKFRVETVEKVGEDFAVAMYPAGPVLDPEEDNVHRTH